MMIIGVDITIEPMKEADISIKKIEEVLTQISEGIMNANQLNLTDINIICEDIYGAILNRLYGYNLLSANAEISRNFAAVDLVDPSKGVAFQITSSYKPQKVKYTISKFNKYYLDNDSKYDLFKYIRSLNILFLKTRDKDGLSNKDDILLENGSVFSFSDNIYDNITIVQEIEKRSNAGDITIINDIYELLMLVLNSSRMEKSTILKDYMKSRGIFTNKSISSCFYSSSRGLAKISAFYDNKGVCARLEFLSASLNNAIFDLNNEILEKEYFVDEKEFYKIHLRYHTTEDNFRNSKVIFNVYKCEHGIPMVLIDSLTAYHVYLLANELRCKIEELK